MEFSIRFGDRQIVDACDTSTHQAVFVKLPVLVAAGTEPIAGIVMPFVGKAHSDTVFMKSPQLIDEAIV